MTISERLSELGIVLPPAPAPAGLYAPAVEAGGMLYISGQLPVADGALLATGKCPTVSIEEAAGCARQCAINALAVAQHHLGTLDRVVRAVRVGGFVASEAGFTEQPQVVNGASQLLIDVFGDAGRHARSAIGVAELPRGVPVEVEFQFQVRS